MLFKLSNVNFTLFEYESNVMLVIFKRLFFLFVLNAISSLLYANIAVPFELINGLIVVEAEVNGEVGNYIIDSGSNGILLNENGRANSEIYYQTLTSTLTGSKKEIKSFRVGDFEVSELQGFSTDLSNLELYLKKSVAGILGCSVFTPNSLVFDFHNSKMIISENGLEKSELEGLISLPYEIIEDLPIATINIGGSLETFILDSGASSHFVDYEVLKLEQGDVLPTGIKKNIVTAGGKDEISLEYKIHNCLIGDQQTAITAFEKDFSLVSEALGKKISGLLSLSQLSSGKVYFDLKSKFLYYN